MQETRRFVLYLWRLPHKSRQFAYFYNNWHRCHYVGWVCHWFSPLLREVFLCVLQFSPLLKNPTLPNSNSIWNTLTHFNEFSRTPKCFMGKQITLFLITILQFTISWKFNISQKFIWVQSDFCAYNLPKKVNLWSFGIILLPWKIGCETKPGLFGEYGSGLIHSLGRHLSRNGKYELTEASRFTHPGIDLLQRTYK